jgi:transposase
VKQMSRTILEKRTLVDEATLPNVRAKILAETNGINYHTLKKYRYRVRRGLPLFEKDGRPLRLDEDSNNLILQFMSETAGWTRYSLYPLIKREALETSRRRYPNKEPLRISKSSVRRHALRLITVFESNVQNYRFEEDGDYWNSI